MEKDKFFHELLAGTENHYNNLRATKKLQLLLVILKYALGFYSPVYLQKPK